LRNDSQHWRPVLHNATKKRIERLEAQARAETPEVRIAWVDEEGVIVSYTPILPVKRRNAHEALYIDYRTFFQGGSLCGL
jgi:hypothetical protein